ncbi:hypothetical protein NN561_018670 [Cricetulus griseus]
MKHSSASWTRVGITRARDAGSWRLSWVHRGAPRRLPKHAPGLRCGVWADGHRQQPSPIRVRGGAPGRGGLERPEGGSRWRPAPELRAPTRIPPHVRACWVRVCGRSSLVEGVQFAERKSLLGMINRKVPVLCIVAS